MRVNRCRALEQTLGLGVARLEDDSADGELAAEACELLRGPAAAGVDHSLAVPRRAARAARPARPRQRAMPKTRSGAWLEKTSAAASARDQHGSAVTTKPPPRLSVADRARLARL